MRVINETFHRRLASSRRRLSDWDFAEGEPVIFTVNDYDRELYNGSLGSVMRVMTEPQMPEDGGSPVRMTCDFDGRKVGLSDEDLGHTELAYAITVHKAQGSQFRRVVMPVAKSRLLDRTLVYTALTRGVEQVVFVGDRRAFEEAAASPSSGSLRRVGFSI